MTAPVSPVEDVPVQKEWDHIRDFISVYLKSCDGRWVWWRNSKCKYVELRVDMRTGHCIIRDRYGNRLNPDDLKYQFIDPLEKQE